MEKQQPIKTVKELFRETQKYISQKKMVDWRKLHPFVARKTHICDICSWIIRTDQLYYGNQYRKAHYWCAHFDIKRNVDPADWIGLDLSVANGEEGKCGLCDNMIDEDQRIVKNGSIVVHSGCLVQGMALFRKSERSNAKNHAAGRSTLKRLHQENEALRRRVNELETRINELEALTADHLRQIEESGGAGAGAIASSPKSLRQVLSDDDWGV